MLDFHNTRGTDIGHDLGDMISNTVFMINHNSSRKEIEDLFHDFMI